MKRILFTTAGALALAAALAACDGGGDDSVEVVTPSPPPAAAPLEDSFGLAFGATFRASANTDPREPSTTDINPISFTTDPTPVN